MCTWILEVFQTCWTGKYLLAFVPRFSEVAARAWNISLFSLSLHTWVCRQVATWSLSLEWLVPFSDWQPCLACSNSTGIPDLLWFGSLHITCRHPAACWECLVRHSSSLSCFVSQRSGYTEFIPLLSIGENLIWKEMQPGDLLICDSDLSLLLTVHLHSCFKGKLVLLEINENCKLLSRANGFPRTSGGQGAVIWRSLQVKEICAFQWCLHQAVYRGWKFQSLLLMWKYKIPLIFQWLFSFEHLLLF